MATLKHGLNMKTPFNRDQTLIFTLDVRITKEFWIRFWIGKKLIELACRIWNCDVEFTSK